MDTKLSSVDACTLKLAGQPGSKRFLGRLGLGFSVLALAGFMGPCPAQSVGIEVKGTGTVTVQGTKAKDESGTVYALSEESQVFGLYGNKDVDGGSLTVKDSVLQFAAGGYSSTDSLTGKGSVFNSTVTVSKSFVEGIYGGYGLHISIEPEYGGDSYNNHVIVTKSESNYVAGGYAPHDGKAYGNEVSFSDGKADIVNGGIVSTGTGAAYSNTVVIKNSLIRLVTGGAVEGKGDATGNRVTFEGGRIEDYNTVGGPGQIIGGMAVEGNATGNTVFIKGSPDLTLATVYGGYNYGAYNYEDGIEPEGYDLRSGNKLVVNTDAAVTAHNIHNFEDVSVTVPALSDSLKEKSFLTLTDTAGTDFSKSSLTVTVAQASADGLTLNNGDRLMLVANKSGLTLGKYSVSPVHVADASQLTVVNLVPEADKTSLSLVVSGKGTRQAAVLSEAHAAGGAMVLAGADMAAGPGMAAAVQAFDKEEVPYGLTVFGAVNGASQKYNMDSHIDLRTVSLIAGPVFGAATGAGRLTCGAFFEYGAGSFGAEHDMQGPEINGDGTLSYMGGGILARMDFLNTGDGHFYVEASGRAGTLRNGFESSDARLKNTVTGRELDYDMDMAYQSLHGAAGYVWNAAEDLTLDMYGRYLWARMFADSTTSASGGRIEYDDFNSSRVRLGARLTWDANECCTPYVGAAFEHEFDGEARVTANGCDVDTSDLQGSSGIGELGLTFKPSPAGLPLTIDLNVQGYAGKRQGFSGNLMVLYQF